MKIHLLFTFYSTLSCQLTQVEFTFQPPQQRRLYHKTVSQRTGLDWIGQVKTQIEQRQQVFMTRGTGTGTRRSGTIIKRPCIVILMDNLSVQFNGVSFPFG